MKNQNVIARENQGKLGTLANARVLKYLVYVHVYTCICTVHGDLNVHLDPRLFAVIRLIPGSKSANMFVLLIHCSTDMVSGLKSPEITCNHGGDSPRSLTPLKTPIFDGLEGTTTSPPPELNVVSEVPRGANLASVVPDDYDDVALFDVSPY